MHTVLPHRDHDTTCSGRKTVRPLHVVVFLELWVTRIQQVMA